MTIDIEKLSSSIVKSTLPNILLEYNSSLDDIIDSTNSSNSNNSNSNSNNSEDIIKILISQILLDSIEPLTIEIATATCKVCLPILANYHIQLRKKFLANMEFQHPKIASSMVSIPYTTLYSWIANGLLRMYSIGNDNYVSMTEVNKIMKKYKPHKTHKTHKKQKSVESVKGD